MGEFDVRWKESQESRGFATPVGVGRGIDIELGSNPMIASNQMTAAEALAHEMIHMSIEAARQLKSMESSDVNRELTDLYRQVIKQLKVEDLMSDNVFNETAERKIASERLAYMQNENSGVSEFTAFGLTNETLVNKLKSIQVDKNRPISDTNSMWGKLAELVLKIYDALRVNLLKKNKDENSYEMLLRLVEELQKVNAKSVGRNKDAVTMLNKVSDIQQELMNKANVKILDGVSKVADVADVLLDKALAGEGKAREALRAGKAVIKWYGNPSMNKAQIAGREAANQEFGNLVDGTWISGILSPEGTLARIADGVQQDDNTKSITEQMAIVANQVDSTRENTIHQVGGSILGEISGIGKEGQEAITETVLELDMQALLSNYKVSEIKELMGNESKVDEAIVVEQSNLKELNSDIRAYNYYASQAKGLGAQLVNHIGGSSINTSAQSIYLMDGVLVNMVDSSKDMPKLNVKDAMEIVKTIDRLATLEAMKVTDSTLLSKVNDTVSESGMNNILLYHKLHADMTSELMLANGNLRPIKKGLLKDTRPDWLTSKVASEDEDTQKSMKKKGYKLINDGIKHANGYGLYISKTASMGRFDKQATLKINANPKVTDIIQLDDSIEDSVKKIKEATERNETILKEAKKEVLRQFEGVVIPKRDGFTPMIKKNGEISYGVTIDKDILKRATEQDKRAPVMLGKMIAEVEERAVAKALNRKVFNQVLKDQQENYARGEVNSRVYIEIGPNAKWNDKHSERYAKEVWENVPFNIKQAVNNRKDGEQWIAVRRDLADMYFGSRAPSLLDMRLPFTNNQTTEDLLLALKHGRAIVDVLKMTGDIWQEIMSMVKVDIVLRMPAILVGNIISNFNYSVALGQAPWTVAANQIKMFKATHKYMQDKRDVEKRIKELRAGIDTSRDNKLEIRVLRQSMKDSAVAPLMENGMFTAIMEDVSNRDLETQTRAGKFVDKYTSKIPKVIRNAASQLYMTEDTSIFRSMMLATQYSDFVARANRYHYQVDQGRSKEVALKAVLDEFVNYTKVDSKFIRWVNAMGPIRFTKFFIGANKTINQKIKERPLQIALMAMLPGMEDPTNALPFVKDFSYTIQSPVELLKESGGLMTPDILRELGVL